MHKTYLTPVKYQTKRSGGEKGRVGERERERARDYYDQKKSGCGHKVKLLG